jgi:hypothetical protein
MGHRASGWRGGSTKVTDGLAGVIGAVLVGSLLAVAVAVGLSPLAPIGPVRAVYPSRGVAWDWTVLGAGVVMLVAGLSGLAALLAYRAAPHRAQRREQPTRGDSTLARAALAAGLPGAGTDRDPLRRPARGWP